jgi:hypothetical protein
MYKDKRNQHSKELSQENKIYNNNQRISSKMFDIERQKLSSCLSTKKTHS